MFDTDLFLRGGVFTHPTSLGSIIDRRFNIVYGRNGSGKSTIARAFRAYQLDKPGERDLVLTKDKLNPVNEDWSRVLVFNEDFINDNVKVDGLNSIVTIGKSAQNYDQIKDLEKQKQDLEKEVSDLNTELGVLNGTERTAGSVAEAEKKLTTRLKEGFMVRLSNVDGHKRKLMPDLYQPLLSMKPWDKYSIKDVEAALNAKIDKYLLFQEGALIVWNKPNLSLLPDLDKVNELLAEKVRPSELTEEEQEIIEDLSGALAGENFLYKTEEFILKGDRKYCPLCHQPLDNEYKKLLQERLLKFRDKKVEEFQETVRSALSAISILDSNLPDTGLAEHKGILEAAKKAEDRINEMINEIIETLNAKISNPLSVPALSFDKQTFDSLVGECSSAMDKVREAVDNYNEKLQEKDQLYKEIIAENQRLAFQENQDAIRVYNERKAKKDEITSKITNLRLDIGQIERNLSSLQAQNDHVEEAMNQINYYLGIIFADRKLELALGEGKGKYKLLIRNKDSYIELPPTHISSGERNALALAYFFACVLENKTEGYDYSDSAVLVIDDPVSSFDAENKAGVISLLSLQIKKILKGNDASKVLVLTHDFTTLRELCDQRKNLFKDVDNEISTFIRIQSNHSFRSIETRHILENMEYYNDLQDIYRFANFQSPEDYDSLDSMGNTIRRFAESYATRMFKCQWSDLFYNDRRLECIPEKIRDRFKAYAIRTVLNSESHGVFSVFEPVEIQRTARLLLIYMLFASKDHLYAFTDNGKVKQIEEWAQEF